MRLGPLDLLPVLYVCRRLRAADIREIEATRYGAHDPDELAMQIIREWAPHGQGFVAYANDGTPVAFFGATQPWPGMFSCYMLATDRFGEVALPLTKFVKRVFIPHLDARANRIEARSIDGHRQAHRWLWALGAKEESRMYAYGRGAEDFIVFTLPTNPDAANVGSNLRNDG